MADDQKPPSVNNISLQAAVAQVIALGLTAGAVRLGMEAKSIAEAVIPISMSLAVLIVAIYNVALTHLNAVKAKKSEMLAPGLTKVEIPKGMELTTKISLNDPSNNDPPIVLSETVKTASDLPEVNPLQIIKQVLLFLSPLCIVITILGLGSCSQQPRPLVERLASVALIDGMKIGITAGLSPRLEQAYAQGKMPKPIYLTARAEEFAALKTLNGLRDKAIRGEAVTPEEIADAQTTFIVPLEGLIGEFTGQIPATQPG